MNGPGAEQIVLLDDPSWPTPVDVIDPKTLAHRDDRATAKEAALRASQSHEQTRLVWAAIGVYPMIAAELDVIFPEWTHRYGARRLSTLTMAEIAVPTGERRFTENAKGADVMRVSASWSHRTPKWEGTHPSILLGNPAAAVHASTDRIDGSCPFPACAGRIFTSPTGVCRHLRDAHSATSQPRPTARHPEAA